MLGHREVIKSLRLGRGVLGECAGDRRTFLAPFQVILCTAK